VITSILEEAWVTGKKPPLSLLLTFKNSTLLQEEFICNIYLLHLQTGTAFDKMKKILYRCFLYGLMYSNMFAR